MCDKIDFKIQTSALILTVESSPFHPKGLDIWTVKFIELFLYLNFLFFHLMVFKRNISNSNINTLTTFHMIAV